MNATTTKLGEAQDRLKKEAAAKAAAEAKKAKKGTATEYVILQELEVFKAGEVVAEGEKPIKAWITVANVKAVGKPAALKAIGGQNFGRFKAVPASNWKGPTLDRQEQMQVTEKLTDE